MEAAQVAVVVPHQWVAQHHHTTLLLTFLKHGAVPGPCAQRPPCSPQHQNLPTHTQLYASVTDIHKSHIIR